MIGTETGTERSGTTDATDATELLRRALTSPVTVATYVLLVVPFALGWIKTALFSPLAIPGYLLFGIGTAIGNAIAPRLDFWVYWVPFLGGCYGVAVGIGAGYEWWRTRAGTDGSETVADGEENGDRREQL